MIFLSHDDVDHSGNLDEAMTACPNATLVCNWAMIERLRVPARTVSLGHGRRTPRHRRPNVAGRPPARVRLPHDAGAVRPDHRRVLGGRHVRHAAPGPDDGSRRSRPGLLGRRLDAVRTRCRQPLAVDGRPRQVRTLRRPDPGSRHHHDRGVPHPGHRRSCSSSAPSLESELPKVDALSCRISPCSTRSSRPPPGPNTDSSADVRRRSSRSSSSRLVPDERCRIAGRRTAGCPWLAA